MATQYRLVQSDRTPPRVVTFTDSIWWGVGSNAIAGPREPVYNAALAAGAPIYFVGTNNAPGNSNTFTVDPWCECWPGIDTTDLNTLIGRMAPWLVRVALYACGINDIIAGSDAPTVVAGISTGLDNIQSYMQGANWRIIVSPILKHLNPSYDTVAQAVNALIPSMVAGKSYASKVIYDPGIYDCIPNPTVGVNMFDQTHPNDVGYGYVAARAYTYSIGPAVMATRTP